MTKSRTALRLTLCPALLTLAATPGRAQGVDPQALIDAQRSELRNVLTPGCPDTAATDEIVICGTRNDERFRVPPQDVPGSSPNGARSGGEQRAAMAANDQRCTPVGRAQQCNGGLNVIGIGVAIARAVGQAVANRD